MVGFRYLKPCFFFLRWNFIPRIFLSTIGIVVTAISIGLLAGGTFGNFIHNVYFTRLFIPSPERVKKCRCLRVCPVGTPRPSLPNRMSPLILL